MNLQQFLQCETNARRRAKLISRGSLLVLLWVAMTWDSVSLWSLPVFVPANLKLFVQIGISSMAASLLVGFANLFQPDLSIHSYANPATAYFNYRMFGIGSDSPGDPFARMDSQVADTFLRPSKCFVTLKNMGLLPAAVLALWVPPETVSFLATAGNFACRASFGGVVEAMIGATVPTLVLGPERQAKPATRRESLAEDLPTAEDFSDVSSSLRRRDRQRLSGHAALQFGGLTMQEHDALTHIAIAGEQGSGKSVLLRHLLAQVLERAKQDSATRLFLTDPKPDLVSVLTQLNFSSYRIVNPLDLRGCCYAIHEDIVDTVDAQALAHVLFPDNSSHQQFFVLGPRLLVQVAIEYFQEKGIAWYLRDLLNFFDHPDDLEQIALESPHVDAIYQWLSKNGETLSNLVLTVKVQLNQFAPIAAAEQHHRLQGREFSMTRWVNDPAFSQLLLLTYDRKSKSALDRYYQLQFDAAAIQVNSGVECNHAKTWFFIDEALDFANVPQLGTLAFTSRSKGAVLCLATQSNDSFNTKAKGTANQNLLERLGNLALLRARNKDAEWASLLFQEIERRNTTTSTNSESRSVQTTEHKFTNRRVPPHIFTEEKRPRDANAVIARYIGSPEYGGGSWKYELPMAQWPPESNSQAAFQRVPGDWTKLSPWDDDDFSRLSLGTPTDRSCDDEPPPPPFWVPEL